MLTLQVGGPCSEEFTQVSGHLYQEPRLKDVHSNTSKLVSPSGPLHSPRLMTSEAVISLPPVALPQLGASCPAGQGRVNLPGGVTASLCSFDVHNDLVRAFLVPREPSTLCVLYSFLKCVF